MGIFEKKDKKKKEPFKERPIGKVAGTALNIVGDIAKIPSIKNWFKGEKKLAGMSWQLMAVLVGAVVVFSLLLKFGVIDIDTLVILIEEMMSQ